MKASLGSPIGAFKERARSWSRNPFSEAERGWTLALFGLLVGLAIRLWSIRQARFSGEESWFWSIGRDIATGTNIPALGHPISGSSARHPGAAFFWLIGLTQLAGPSPLRAYAAFSLCGLCALVPLALVVARAFDRATGLAFLLLASVSPWWIVYTNSAWPGYLFPTLCALVLISLSAVVNSPSVVARAGLAFLLIVGFQIHLSLLHYWLIVLVTIGIWRPRLGRAALAGMAIGLLCYVPYLVDEVRHGFANTIAIAHRSQGGHRTAVVLQGLLLYFFGFTTTDISYLWNEGFWFPFDPARFWRGSGIAETTRFFASAGLSAISWAALVISWVFTAAAWLWFLPVTGRNLRANLRAPANVLSVACLTAVGGIPLFYLLSGKGGYPHYVSTVLPLAFLPPARLLGKLLARPAARWAGLAYLLLFAAGGLLGLRGYYAVDARWSVPQSTAAVEFILERTRASDGRQVPFRLEFGFSPHWPSAYELIAKQVFRAPFPMTSEAADVFRVEARSPGQTQPADAETLFLSNLVVRHERR